MQQKLKCAKAIIDIYFDIKNADEQLFSYLDSESYQSLLYYVHENDRDKLRNILENCEYEDCTCLIKIKRLDNIYRDCLFICRRSRIRTSCEQLYEVELSDIFDLREEYNNSVSEAEFFATLISMNSELFYVFDYTTQLLTIFGIVNGQRNKAYEGSMAKVLEELKHENNVDDITCKHVEDWFESILSREVDSLYEFPNGIGKEFVLGFPCCLTGGVRTINKIEYYMGNIGKYTDCEKAEKDRMVTVGMTDPLTGLLNKREIAKVAQHSIEKKTSNEVALFILDIDDFKIINDTYGHMFGDKVIVKVAEVIARCVGNNGYVGRIGGDEFMGVIEGVTCKEDIRPILRSIRSSIEYLFKDEMDNISLSCSIGVARTIDVTTGYDDMFRCADKCLYLAKRKGKNRYIIYIPDVHGAIEKDTVDHIIKVSDNEKKTSLSAIMVELMLQLHSEGMKSMDQMLEKTAYGFNVDRIVVYWGEHMKRVASYEMIETLEKEFPFVDEEYDGLFDENGMFVARIARFAAANEKIAEFYQNRHTVKIIQKKIVKGGKVRGIISYEICHKTSKLSDEIKDCLIIIAEALGEMCYENEDKL